MILALSLALAPVFIEPLRLTTGLEVEAQYSAAEDGFCLALEDFVLVSRDLAGAVEAIDEERRSCDARVKRAEGDCAVMTSAAIEQNKALKVSLEASRADLEETRFEVKVWRVASVGVLVLSSVAVMVIATR